MVSHVARCHSLKEEIYRPGLHYAALQLPESRVCMPTDMRAHFEPKGRNQVQNDGRAERQAGSINEVQPDAASRNVHSFTKPGADAKSLLLNEIFQFV